MCLLYSILYEILSLKKDIIKVNLTAFIIVTLFSCQTNPHKAEALLKELEEPVVSSEEVEWLYTVKGEAVYKLISPKVYRYIGQTEYIEFPLGIEVYSFNNSGEQKSFMKSDYAIKHLDNKIIEAKGRVFLQNSIGEKLETEQIFWDEKREKIYTEEVVKITKKGQLIIGEGFQSNTLFSNYTIKKSRGIITLDEGN